MTVRYNVSRRRTAARPAALACALLGTLAATFCALLGAFPAAAHSASRTAPDIVVAGFEGASYPAGWTVTGTAFGRGPAQGALPNQMQVSGFEGHGLVNSYNGADGSVGTLTSAAFPISRRYLSFLIGGGRHPDTEKIELVVNGRVVRRSTGLDDERLSWTQWDVSALQGRSATIKITDAETGRWGHINIDSITLTDRKLPDERTAELASALAAIRRAIPAAEADPRRPAYHFHTPAQWMNDPNGPIYYRGWYNVFYQFNPYGSQWGSMHWGHARSRDLVNWEHLPVALWPSKREGEDHVYSGSTFPRGDGKPMAFYTSIGPRDPEQWAALPDTPELLLWHKAPGDPVVTEATSGTDHIAEWRDPFLFAENGVTYMVTGGGLNGRGIVALYRTANSGLTSWKYLGVLFQHPDSQIHNVECPNLAKVDGKWVLLTSTYGKVESFVGRLDLAHRKFIAEKRGVLADGSYASQLLHAADGSVIHLAWMHTDQGKAWNGYMTLPSALRIAPDDTLYRQPIARFSALRGKHVRIVGRSVTGVDALGGQISGQSLELIADIDPGTASSVTLKLRVSQDGSRSVAIRYEPATRTLFTQGRDPVVLPASRSNALKLHLFVDRGALDVYAAGGAVTQCAFFPDAQPGDVGFQVAAQGGTARITRMDSYTMKPAAFDLSHFH